MYVRPSLPHHSSNSNHVHSITEHQNSISFRSQCLIPIPNIIHESKFSLFLYACAYVRAALESFAEFDLFNLTFAASCKWMSYVRGAVSCLSRWSSSSGRKWISSVFSAGSMSSSSSAAGDRRQLTVTRIFSDENGESQFGSFTISLTGSGTRRERERVIIYCCRRHWLLVRESEMFRDHSVPTYSSHI